MLKLKQVSITERPTLERLLLENLDLIESGLKPVHSSILPPSSSLSFLLARDETGRAVIIEYDIVSQDSILFEALDHFGWLSSHLSLISQLTPQSVLVPALKPRLVFVVPRIPSSFEKHLGLWALSPEFYAYMYLTAGEEQGLLIQPHGKAALKSLDSAASVSKGSTLTHEEEAFFKENPNNR